MSEFRNSEMNYKRALAESFRQRDLPALEKISLLFAGEPAKGIEEFNLDIPEDQASGRMRMLEAILHQNDALEDGDFLVFDDWQEQDNPPSGDWETSGGKVVSGNLYKVAKQEALWYCRKVDGLSATV